ncbi:PHP domain-containing protein, partial [Roseomonas mucosa]
MATWREATMSPAYAELGCRSNFTLLDGASHPQELVATAAALGHAGVGLCDANSLAGVVRGHVAAREVGLPFVVG